MPMADPVYPNNQSRFPAYPEPVEEPLYHPNLSPARAETRSNLALSAAAERVGNMVGSALERVKELPDRLQVMKQRFTVIRGRKQAELSDRASELADDVKNKAQRTVENARSRAERLAYDEPMKLIAGAAGVGIVLGIALRLWRDHGD